MFAKVIGLIMQSNINLTTLYFMNTLQSLLDTFVTMLKKIIIYQLLKTLSESLKHTSVHFTINCEITCL